MEWATEGTHRRKGRSYDARNLQSEALTAAVMPYGKGATYLQRPMPRWSHPVLQVTAARIPLENIEAVSIARRW